MHSDWVEQVLRYWFEELPPEAWFRNDERVDAAIRERFGAMHDELARVPSEQLATPPNQDLVVGFAGWKDLVHRDALHKADIGGCGCCAQDVAGFAETSRLNALTRASAVITRRATHRATVSRAMT